MSAVVASLRADGHGALVRARLANLSPVNRRAWLDFARAFYCRAAREVKYSNRNRPHLRGKRLWRTKFTPA